MKRRNNVFMDTLKVLRGESLDTPTKKTKKTTGSPAPKKKSPTKSADESRKERKAQARKEAVDDALVYASSGDANKDLVAALTGRGMSVELRNLLECLADDIDVRTTILSQGDVKPGPDDYDLSYRFVNPASGDWCNEEAEALLSAGVELKMLEHYNIALRVVKIRRLDGLEAGEASDEEYETIRKEIVQKYSKKKK